VRHAARRLKICPGCDEDCDREEMCESCGACEACCDCGDLFDADELGSDPEDDECRD
jgi:hypothetical protein